MKTNIKYTIILFFALLLVLILSSKTIWRVCSVCGVQDFERSLFGKNIELISTREVDEYGTYAKWKEDNGKICSHQWVIVDEFSNQVKNRIKNKN